MAKRVVKRGSIVLVQYPFSDLSSVRARPAVILTPNNLLPRIDDVLCLFISSVMRVDLLPSDFVLDKNHASFAASGLKFRSVFRPHKLALLHKSLIFRVIGAADDDLGEERIVSWQQFCEQVTRSRRFTILWDFEGETHTEDRPLISTTRREGNERDVWLLYQDWRDGYEV